MKIDKDDFNKLRDVYINNPDFNFDSFVDNSVQIHFAQLSFNIINKIITIDWFENNYLNQIELTY